MFRAWSSRNANDFFSPMFLFEMQMNYGNVDEDL